MVRANEVFLGELVELRGQALGQTARVHEDQRAAVGSDELEQLLVDVRPDAGACGSGGGRTARRLFEDLAHRREIVDRDDHLDVELLATAGVDDGYRAQSAVASDAAEEPRDLVERALRC